MTAFFRRIVPIFIKYLEYAVTKTILLVFTTIDILE